MQLYINNDLQKDVCLVAICNCVAKDMSNVYPTVDWVGYIL